MPLSEQKMEIISRFMTSRPNYNLDQVNGQRIYKLGLDNEVTTPPQKGSEVYITRLPRDCYEDELVPLFETIGPIVRMRLIMDFSGTTHGYGFVEYADPSTAKSAIKTLDGHEIRPDQPIVVTTSFDKRRLFIGGIPKHKKQREVLKEMKRVSDGVKDVILYLSVYSGKNRGFCFVEYQTHMEAALAIKKMGTGFKLWKNHEVRVDWADPEVEVDEEVMKQVRILYVRNIGIDIDEIELKQVFSFDKLRIERVKKIRDFAFIHYETREEAEIAMNLAKGTCFVKKNPTYKNIEVSYARPQKNRIYRKRTPSTVSVESTPVGSTYSGSTSTPGSNQIFYLQPVMPHSSPRNQVDDQLKYYQSLCQSEMQNNIQNQITVPYVSNGQQMVPIKYDYPIEDNKNNFNFFLVWVPVVLIPNNQNKGLSPTDNSYFGSNNI